MGHSSLPPPPSCNRMGLSVAGWNCFETLVSFSKCCCTVVNTALPSFPAGPRNRAFCWRWRLCEWWLGGGLPGAAEGWEWTYEGGGGQSRQIGIYLYSIQAFVLRLQLIAPKLFPKALQRTKLSGSLILMSLEMRLEYAWLVLVPFTSFFFFCKISPSISDFIVLTLRMSREWMMKTLKPMKSFLTRMRRCVLVTSTSVYQHVEPFISLPEIYDDYLVRRAWFDRSQQEGANGTNGQKDQEAWDWVWCSFHFTETNHYPEIVPIWPLLEMERLEETEDIDDSADAVKARWSGYWLTYSQLLPCDENWHSFRKEAELAEDDANFPDMIDTPIDVAARVRFVTTQISNTHAQ